jgi:hypothetical protein
MRKNDQAVREAVARIAQINPKGVTCEEDGGYVIVNFQTSMTMPEKWEAIEREVAAIVGHDRVSIT